MENFSDLKTYHGDVECSESDLEHGPQSTRWNPECFGRGGSPSQEMAQNLFHAGFGGSLLIFPFFEPEIEFMLYSNHLNTRLVVHWNGKFVSSCQTIRYLNGGLTTGLKKPVYGPKCLVFEWSTKSFKPVLGYQTRNVLLKPSVMQPMT